MIRLTLLVAALALAGCGGDVAPSYGAPPLADVRVPAVAPAEWAFGGAGGTIRRFGYQDVIFLQAGEAPNTLSIPLASGLEGARRVRVHYMADQPFSLAASLSASPGAARDGVDTKRQQQILELELPEPAGGDAGTLTLTCQTRGAPVLILRVQVMG